MSNKLGDRDTKCRLCGYSIWEGLAIHNKYVADNHCIKFTHGKRKPASTHRTDDKFECEYFKEKVEYGSITKN